MPTVTMDKKDRIDAAVREGATALHPKLVEALCLEFRGSASLSLHVQDGVLNHVKANLRESLELDGKQRERTKPNAESVSAVLKGVGWMLRRKLDEALTPGFHGTVVLSMTFENGTLTHVEANSERVHKPVVR